MNSIPQRELGSSTAHRQGAVLRWSLAGTVTLLAAYLIGLELQRRGWVTYQFPATVLWCAIPYAIAAYWLYSGAHLPRFEGRSFLFVATAVPYLTAPLGFALLQRPYSRGAVLLSYLLSLAWFLIGHWRDLNRHGLCLTYLDDTVPRRLQALLGAGADEARRKDITLVPWPEHGLDDAAASGWAGVVLDRHAPSHAARDRRISGLRLQHVRLYSVEAVAALLSGRMVLPDNHAQDLWALDGNPAYDTVKRMVDLAATLATLPLWLPLCLVAGLAVKLDSPGPMLFSQLRVGRNGREFCIWKLRSMRHAPSEQGARFAQPNDDRITPVGRFIRRTRLDELPQLWNVLRGDMGLIGPRPEQAEFVRSFAERIPAYPYRHLVRPGLTGWAQVQQGYADSEEQTAVKLSYDLYYVAHYSVALDLLIAWKTLRIVASGFGSR
ncbi:sugar transferase [Paracidovorax cattleyae]|uniref:Sugar transferase involved in LPS biosynthesis (Colanic, teichoic acid) n=1 Tax=Paracidovorax cattleyae TaxID=80868 RepID=A0A1H0KDN9_9BURK|nr:sugar transferase [Paracidovorax cattleyae]AVS73530.1 sugar transferase [Paracidovorax cattleyae]MBF9265623.1 sugar transferase [Paracidovorax cattleyae]SDO54074.1 Sugar transferase involved in LPS biosynthesis (colanic, teichoic acid) [Paracidovorax cattleyae]